MPRNSIFSRRSAGLFVFAAWIGLTFTHLALAQPRDEAAAEALAPLLDAQALLVSRFAPAQLDPAAIVGQVRTTLGPALDDADQQWLQQMETDLRSRKETLQAAGIQVLYGVYTLADPQPPGLFVAPLPSEAQAGQAIERLKPLLDQTEMVAEVHGPRIVLGQAGSLARWKQRTAVPRPDLIEPLSAAPEAAITLVVSPGADHRRALREMLPRLPDFLGGGPTSGWAEGVQWARLELGLPPQLRARLTVKTREAQVAAELHGLAIRSLDWAGQQPQVTMALPWTQLRPLLTPQVQGDQLVLDWSEADRVSQVFQTLMTPAILAARSAARRTQGMNQLKQIGLAMHNYHDVHRRFPPQAIRSKDGKPLLSWRVAILPFLEQNDLYRQFRLEEPWDSEHNRRLLDKMPQVYADPLTKAARAEPGLTAFLAPLTRQPPEVHVPLAESERRRATDAQRPREPVAIFDVPDGAPISWITDGTVNTILVLKAAPEAAVPWTKPEDWVLDEQQPLKHLFPEEGGKYGLVLFADGSVRVLNKNIPVDAFRLLLWMNDGKPVRDIP